MTNFTKVTLLSAALAAFLLPAAAQNSSPSAAPSTPATTGSTPTTQNPPEGPKEINERKTKQDNRISNGLGDGALTTKEADSLDKKEGQLNQEERQMKAADNGHLTSADRAKLQQQQNQLSHQIYQDKHNAAVRNTDPKSGIGKTEQTQQEHIAQGQKSGQLTAGEATHLENQEAAINHERHNDLAANGDKLTPQERTQIKQQQKQLNKQIYKDKHNNAKK
jgi:hypothetical protein